MQLQQTVNSVFFQLSESIEKSSQADYSSSWRNLSLATIGGEMVYLDLRNDYKFDSGISFTSRQAAL